MDAFGASEPELEPELDPELELEPELELDAPAKTNVAVTAQLATTGAVV